MARTFGHLLRLRLVNVQTRERQVAMNKLLYLPFIYTFINNSFSYQMSPSLMADIVAEISSVHNTKCVEVLVHEDMTQEESEDYDKLLRLLSSKQLTKLYDMNKYVEEKARENDLSVTKCFRPIRVTIGNELSRIPFHKTSYWYGNAISKPVTVVFMNTTIESYFQNASLPYNLIIIGVQRVTEDLIDILEIYRVDKNFPMHVDKVGAWTADKGVYVKRWTVFGRRYDFEGKVFRAGSIEKWPFSTFNGFLDKNQPWDGLFCAVWNELGRLLNFKSVYVRGDGIGIVKDGGNWTGLIDLLLNNEIDVIVADARITVRRVRVLDFTYPLISSWYQIYFKQRGYRLRWNAVFEPFNYDVWVAILMWILVGALCFYVSFHVCVTRGLEPEGRPDVTFLDSFFFMLRTLSFQDYNNVPDTVVCRAVFLMAYVAAAVLVPAYSASFISSLTTNYPQRPFDSFEGLLKDGTYKILLEENTAEYAYFTRATDKTLQEIGEKMVQPIPGIHYTNYSSYGLEMLCRHKKLALFDVQQLIKMKNTAGLSCELLSFTQSLTKVDSSFAFVKGSPYATYIHHHIHRMTEAGLIRRIRNKVSLKTVKNFPPWKPVKLEEVFQIFSFLLLGIILSIFVFFAEIGYRYFQKRAGHEINHRPWAKHSNHIFIP